MPERSPQQLAEHVRDGMFADDRAPSRLGMDRADDRSRPRDAAMTVRDDMLNGHDICHGGLITTLADSRLRLRLQHATTR